jgi:Ser/Thr protein kinase RdoA (MazF antagonist)
MIEDSDLVMSKLEQKSWIMPRVIRTLQGDYSLQIDGHVWCLSEFIASDSHAFVLTPTTVETSGTLLSRLHTDLTSVNVHLRFSLPHFHDTSYHLSRLEKIVSNLTGEAFEQASFVLHSCAQLDPLPTSADQLLHGDPRMNNILFRDNYPFTFIDWDTLLYGSSWIDVGDFVRSLAEECVKDQSLSFKPLLDGFSRGYARNGDTKMFLAKALNASRHITLELASRYLVDVVEDSYWAWDETRFSSRAESNLSRAHETIMVYNLLND